MNNLLMTHTTKNVAWTGTDENAAWTIDTDTETR